MEEPEPASATHTVMTATVYRPSPSSTSTREDCWSEGATVTLIDAWGERYLELNRGNLKQKHWQEVADAVNSRHGSVSRPRRTDVQCKNRLDTLKKKYKLEKARASESDGSFQSKWPFFDRLHNLLGPSKKASPPPLAVVHPYHQIPQAVPLVIRPVKEKRPLPCSAGGGVPEDSNLVNGDSGSSESGDIGVEDGVKELAKAIARFGEIYERVEMQKQRQMMELEKQRMEFSKAVEYQRMQTFMEVQLKLPKMKKAKRQGASDSYS
ncbi:trihelix transcription factor ASIL2 [Amborella trichopoda]|uniref:trihelix transcription factor ASIL2 n=1 Tax=Amborella trichopoda TaxID=13333 RepID=UPI0005D3110E|nr:trihelix transcription factor ASIL2 [Amborella trichopoda]|eukprot:XP_006852424.2 trihelix transcription factor ASIL2 [Amborella trichopoda]